MITTCQLADGDRKIYWTHNSPGFLFTYSKSRANTGRDLMVMKPVPPEVGRLLLKFLVLVRPCEEILAPYIGMSDSQLETYACHLFVTEGRVMDEAFIRRLLPKLSSVYFGVSIGWNRHRHLVKAIILDITGYDLSASERAEERVEHQVFGHGTSVGTNTYAVEASNHRCAREPVYQAHLRLAVSG